VTTGEEGREGGKIRKKQMKTKEGGKWEGVSD
jgi:hypothetical protein